MRTLKFRVWGWTNDEGTEGDWLDLWDTERYPKSFWYGESLVGMGFTLEQYPLDEFIIQQYTGINDTNGREIYEGDILESTCPFTDNVYIAPVTFKEGCFGVSNIKLAGSSTQLKLAVFKNVVIGNIYENPALKE